MMMLRVASGACRSAAARLTAPNSSSSLILAQQRTMMMMAGGDLPSPLQGTVKSFDTKRVRGAAGALCLSVN